MAKVSISSGIQKFFENKNEIVIEAATVFELLKEIEKKYPNSKNKILSENGKLNRFIKVFVDGEDIECLDFFETKINSKSKIKVLMALAGG